MNRFLEEQAVSERPGEVVGPSNNSPLQKREGSGKSVISQLLVGPLPASHLLFCPQ